MTNNKTVFQARNDAEAQNWADHEAAFGPDVALTAEQLEDKYNPNGDGEHPAYPRTAWENEVSSKVTLLGYWDSVLHFLTTPTEDDNEESTTVTMTSEQRAMVDELRTSGFLVVIWTPNELGDADIGHVEERVIELGNQTIEMSKS